MKTLCWCTVVVLLGAAWETQGQPTPKKGRSDVALKEGSVAPDFTVKDAAGIHTVKLSQRRGKPVVLIFGSCT